MPTSVGVISQIQLPNGNIYDLVDRVTPHDQGLEYVIAYKSGVPVVSNIPAGVTVVYNDTAYIGTKVADSTTYSSIYLVKSPSQEGASDYYDEYITLKELIEGEYKYSWEKLGDTRITIKDITPEYGTASHVTVGSTTGTVTGGSTDKVLGVDTTFSGSSSFTDTSTKGYLHKHAYIKSITPSVDTAIQTLDVDTENLVTTTITGTNGTESVSAVSKTTKKLVTTSITPVSGSTSIYGVGSTTTTASKATAGTAKNVASAGTAVTVGDGTVTASSTNTDILKSATISNETLILGACTLDTTTVTPAVSNGTITPYTFSDVTVPVKDASATTVPTAGTAVTVATGKLASSDTSGDDVYSGLTISPKTVAKAASSATTVATGATSSNGSGSPIVTGVAADATITALTGLGTPTTGNAYDTLDNISTDGDAVVIAVSGTVSTTVTKGTNDQVDALTTAGFVTIPTVSATDVTVVTDIDYEINDDVMGTSSSNGGSQNSGPSAS